MFSLHRTATTVMQLTYQVDDCLIVVDQDKFRLEVPQHSDPVLPRQGRNFQIPGTMQLTRVIGAAASLGIGMEPWPKPSLPSTARNRRRDCPISEWPAPHQTERAAELSTPKGLPAQQTAHGRMA
ncbi:predicted protein [Histoplasma mississippiense (nom. inval.)]|uniref:predicted protein n=1 Tax=Ajellomyces capsulatus (strain NAm1 / WU24) TaxID=2059318 RepID=UPI000157BE7C|nr:predicted protein [Histoplasma mississippiense (nom. inval.)]EDN07145.1 predicted protein [Histoplasma mississippiense (nom. inval.)]